MENHLACARAAPLVLVLLLAACGGGDSVSTPAAGVAPVLTATPPTSSQPAAPSTGEVTITVQDDAGQALPSTRFNYACGAGNTICGSAWPTDKNGISVLPDVRTGQRQILAIHSLGWKNVDVNVEAGHPTAVTVVIAPFLEPTAAILATEILPESVSADRSELEVRLTVAVSGGWDGRQDDGYQGATSWLTGTRVVPCGSDCVEGRDVSYSQSGSTFADVISAETKGTPAPKDYVPPPSPVLPTGKPPYSALLLLDQGRRVTAADPGVTRQYAARNFLRRARQADLVAAAGFAGLDAAGSPGIPEWPLWIPAVGPSPFSNDAATWARQASLILPSVGGSSPLYDALDAGLDRIAASVPTTVRRALVVLTAGDDDGALTPAQRNARWQALIQKKAASSTEIILVAGHLPWNSPERRQLVDLASTGLATLITTYPREASFSKGYVDENYKGEYGGYFDDYYSGLDLAAELLSGAAPVYHLSYRLKATPGAFAAGSKLYGELQLWDNCEPKWWQCDRSKPFVGRIP